MPAKTNQPIRDDHHARLTADWFEGNFSASFAALFETLRFTSITQLRRDGLFVRLDETTARRVGIALDDVVGKHLCDIIEDEPARERLGFIRAIFDRPGEWHLAVDMYWAHQVWHFGYVDPQASDDPAAAATLLTLEPPIDEPLPRSFSCTIYEHVSDPGALKLLTAAEAEVLRLLAMSCTQEEIATELHRSVKAIERRRTTLGRKLNVRNRSELALIGACAGLHRYTREQLQRVAKHSFGVTSPAEQAANLR